MFKINFSLSRNSLTSARAAPSPSWATRCARRRRGRPTTRAASAAPAARPRSAASTSSWTEAPSCARRTTWPRGTSARGAAALSRGRCCRRWEGPSTRGASPVSGAPQTWTGCSSTWRGRRRRIPYARSATQGILAKKNALPYLAFETYFAHSLSSHVAKRCDGCKQPIVEDCLVSQNTGEYYHKTCYSR